MTKAVEPYKKALEALEAQESVLYSGADLLSVADEFLDGVRHLHPEVSANLLRTALMLSERLEAESQGPEVSRLMHEVSRLQHWPKTGNRYKAERDAALATIEADREKLAEKDARIAEADLFVSQYLYLTECFDIPEDKRTDVMALHEAISASKDKACRAEAAEARVSELEKERDELAATLERKKGYATRADLEHQRKRVAGYDFSTPPEEGE